MPHKLNKAIFNRLWLTQLPCVRKVCSSNPGLAESDTMLQTTYHGINNAQKSMLMWHMMRRWALHSTHSQCHRSWGCMQPYFLAKIFWIKLI